ncbi:hypothetical protein PR048_017343 [Dryococelus australis]|uniref:HAT C-terminal dimerisation domain-containing protein n=1 Tax=Dryococelus australis TaxID=614101 RepID=A0ABQ9H9F0_9NEOP|nr:hypothetical protein PR048_017343 [Dryococelus australis]
MNNPPMNDDIVRSKKSNEEASNQKTVIELLSECDRDVFPVISIQLQVLVTLPVSVVTPERTFSTLKRIKTWLRTTMNEDCLIGLALLATHCNITINPDQVIDRFAMSGNRRLKTSRVCAKLGCTTFSSAAGRSRRVDSSLQFISFSAGLKPQSKGVV